MSSQGIFGMALIVIGDLVAVAQLSIFMRQHQQISITARLGMHGQESAHLGVLSVVGVVCLVGGAALLVSGKRKRA